jgi:hypothetical protein
VKALTAAVLVLAPISLAARSQSPDEQEIRRVVTEYYFEGGRAGDSSLVRQGFDMQRAHMFYVQADTMVDVPIPEYVRRVGAGRQRPDFRPDANQRRNPHPAGRSDRLHEPAQGGRALDPREQDLQQGTRFLIRCM